MPNFFMFMGPNATIGHGSLIYSLDWTAEWIVQWLRKMAREDIASVAPKQDVVDELVRYGDEVMKTLTWTGNCKSSQQLSESASLRAILAFFFSLIHSSTYSYLYTDFGFRAC
jgi:hypothetical protein